MRAALLFFLVLVLLRTEAQRTYSTTKGKAIKQFEYAEKNYNSQQYNIAIESLNDAVNTDPNFVEAYLLKAQIFFELGHLRREIECYEKVLTIRRDYNPKVQYLLSIAYFKTEQYGKSIELATEASQMDIQSEMLVRNVEFALKSAKSAKKLYDHPVPFKPINMGTEINSPFDDYWPMLSADGKKLYTTKNILRNRQLEPTRDNLSEDFFVNYKINDSTWSQTYNMGRPLNTPNNEGAPSISADGQTFVFTGCNRNDGKGKCDLYISHRQAQGWSEPKNMGSPINTNALERQPSLSPDGKTLYFTSDRPGTDGLEDLWVSHFDGTNWSTPINLGDSINSHGIEWAPFIHPDGKTLYFVSDGHFGLGGLDIYKSTRLNDTTWSQVKNLGYPINTVNDEQSLFVSIDGELALISSNRANDNNGLDIYQFLLYPEARPDYVNYLTGTVSDTKTNALVKSHIELIDLNTGELILNPESELQTGEYLLCIPSGHNYMLNISQSGYMPYSEHFAMTGGHKDKPYEKHIKLQPIELGAHVILKNIFFELDSYQLKDESKIELEKLIEFMNNNPNVSIEIGGHTDNQGSKAHNATLSDNRAKTVQKYLINHGISATRLTAKGYGMDQPIDTNETEEGRANNRRTEFKVTKK